MIKNNYHVLRIMIDNDKEKTVNFLNNLDNDDFCSLFFTNGIFAILSPVNIIPELDMDKKKHLIGVANAKGFSYIPKTLAERCDECLSYIYPDIKPQEDREYNIVPETNDYILWNDDYDCHTVYIGRRIRQRIIESDSIEYKKIIGKILGTMEKSDLQGSCLEYGPCGGMMDIKECLERNSKRQCYGELFDLEYILNEDVSKYNLNKLYGYE